MFDEIEKGDGWVYEILVEMMEEGKVDEGVGKEGDLWKWMVVLRWNVGREWVRKEVEWGNVGWRREMMEVMGEYLGGEFVGGVCEMVGLWGMGEEIVVKILEIELKGVRKVVEKQGMGISMSDDGGKMVGEKGLRGK